jgi:hypothetical protein
MRRRKFIGLLGASATCRSLRLRSKLGKPIVWVFYYPIRAMRL